MYYIARGTQTQNVFLDDRRIHLHIIPAACRWLWQVIGSGPWAPTPGMQQVLQKERGGRESHHTGPTPLDRLSACTLKTLKRAVRAMDTIQVESLVWAIFDNIMGPGKIPPLSGLETYSQILRCLIGKVYRGLNMRCPTCTSTSFDAEVTTIRLRPGGLEPKKPGKPDHYSMIWDVRKEFAGSYSAFKDKQESTGEDQVMGEVVQTVDPNIHAMKWMKECKCSYREVQLDFWLLLRPLTDGSEESSWQLAHRHFCLYGTGHPPSNPPHTPHTHMWEDSREDERQLWVEAYACALQYMAEVSMGWCWITGNGTRVLKVSKLVETFLNATGKRVSPHIIWQCWPMPCDNTPVQNLEGKRENIVCRLDEVATQCLSDIAWDKFAFPQTDQEFWCKEVLCYHPGKMLDVRAHKMGFRLMLQDNEGQYTNSAHALKIWSVNVCLLPAAWYHPMGTFVGACASLTMMELCTANDMNNMVPSPYYGFELVRPDRYRVP